MEIIAILWGGVNISENASGGDHIYFGAGCKVMSNVKLASDIIIGANAVVTHNFLEENMVIAGIPASVISDKGFASGRDVI